MTDYSSILSKLGEANISSHIQIYEIIEEREVLSKVLTGRKHLYIKFYSSTPDKIINFISDYFSVLQGLKVVDIGYCNNVILRVELCSYSNEWLTL